MVLWLFGLLALVAGVLTRWRIHTRTRRKDERPTVDDETVRRIERTGRIETDEEEPLDRAHIRAEEDRFWNETWDEPEPLWE